MLSFILLAALGAEAKAVNTFLVFPLENHSRNKALNWIGEGVAISISSALQSPGVETISWEERARFVVASDLPPGLPLSRASMIRIAQKASVDRVVFGGYTGNEEKLEIVVQVINIRTLKVSGEKAANGPLSALPAMENEIAWEVLADAGLNGAISRESFRNRSRTAPNKTYAEFIACLALADDEERSKALQKLVDQYKDLPQASFLLGAHYFQDGDCAKAIPLLKPALSDAQSYLETQFMLGTCALKQDNPADAIQAYNAIIARSQALEVLNNLGVAYLRKGDFPLAVQNLVEARKLAKDDLTVGLNLALLRHIQGDELAALTVLEDLVRAHPDHGTAQYLYGIALTSRGQQEKAAAAFDQAVRLGIDMDRMRRQDPRTWSLIFPTWDRRSGYAWAGEAKDGDLRYRH